MNVLGLLGSTFDGQSAAQGEPRRLTISHASGVMLGLPGSSRRLELASALLQVAGMLPRVAGNLLWVTTVETGRDLGG